MAFIPAPSVVQAEIRGTLSGERVENVLYFLAKSPPPTPANVQSLANNLRGWWLANALAWLPVSYVFREVYCTNLSTATSSTATAPADGQTGTRGGVNGAMPNNVSICVSIRTASRGRSARGRNFWPAVIRSDVNENTLNIGSINGILGVYETLLEITEFGTFDFYWVVLSRYTNNAPRPQGLVNLVTNVLVVDATLDSQKRRLPGRGQ